MALICCEVSAPGKVILHGEHSVVYGKTALAASLGLRTTSRIEEYEHNGDDMLVIVLPKISLKLTISQVILREIILEINKVVEPLKTNFSKPKDVNHDKYIERITAFLKEYRQRNSLILTDIQNQALLMIIYLIRAIVLNNVDEPKSMLLTVNSDLTIGAGTGSSASFAVSLAGVLLQYVKYKNLQRYYTAVKRQYVNEEELMELDQHVFSTTEKNLISDWAFACERIAHGSPSGVDNATCTFGSLIEFKKGEKPLHHQLNVRLKILLIDTKVSRQTRVLVQRVADLKARCPQIVNCILDALNQTALTALQVIKKIDSNELDDKSDYYTQLSELFDMNHKLLASLDVSHESLERVREVCWRHGYSSKLTGAGGGGFAIALIPPATGGEFITRLTSDLIREGFDVKTTDIGVEGVKIHM